MFKPDNTMAWSRSKPGTSQRTSIGDAKMAKKPFTHNLSEPLAGATSAKFDINTGSGNVTIDAVAGKEPLLASGTLEYLEDQGLPSTSVDARGDRVTLTLRARSTTRLPF